MSAEPTQDTRIAKLETTVDSIKTTVSRISNVEDALSGLTDKVNDVIAFLAGGMENPGKGMVHEIKELSLKHDQMFREITRIADSVTHIDKRQDQQGEQLQKIEVRVSAAESEIANLRRKVELIEAKKLADLADLAQKAEAKLEATQKQHLVAVKGALSWLVENWPKVLLGLGAVSGWLAAVWNKLPL